MPLTDAERNANADAQAARFPWMSIHNADPGATGANEHTGDGYARVAATWSAASSGGQTSATCSFQTSAGETVTHAGFWSAQSGGTFRASCQRTTGDSAANSAGEYDFTASMDVS